MALVKPDTSRLAKIKVIAVGGGGGNSVNHMIEESHIEGVEFIAVNTDAQVLLNNPAETKLQIGEKLTRGLGSGGNPDMGKQAAEESKEKIKEMLLDSDMVFLTAGMGGGTGTGAISVIAQAAKEAGALTVAIVTKPFAFEGTRRMVVAEEGIEALQPNVDALIVIPNQRLMDVIDRRTTLSDAFKVVDSVLSHGVQGISEIITTPGLINVDFADVRAIMKDAGSALLGIGTGVGDNRAQMAARAAISSPLLEVSIEGAKGILFNIAGGLDITMAEVDEAARIISESADADANIIFGASINEKLSDQMRITVVATGFDEVRSRLGRMVVPKPVVPSAPQGIVSAPPQPVPNPATFAGSIFARPVQTQPWVENKYSEERNSVALEDREKDEWGEKFEIPAFLRQGR
ncbi:MAG: cell division protein FtsZ [Candidatus Blackburnbacteria bacterium RIFCSPHIGHO2_01_FULL_43_15b]|uniref:Cell division protein FtsZ n=1 Tax=Candidatus Blackburnbacteria bacterium RIFCSPHIGHO2_01_FULL_43_15b TaxID=1797513 RepID=A0A1G1V2P8_9BACT|nr:MAG: cell division protein FtsZ [Candidatus Blackburnbacteria bacterium RIFCSPHIGHO2_01_FULL_43_15b]